MAIFSLKNPKELTQEQELVKELLNSKGWRMIEEKLKERRNAALSNLLASKEFSELLRFQARVGEVEWLLKLPHTILSGAKLN